VHKRSLNALAVVELESEARVLKRPVREHPTSRMHSLAGEPLWRSSTGAPSAAPSSGCSIADSTRPSASRGSTGRGRGRGGCGG
jgi:hypothetical protein